MDLSNSIDILQICLTKVLYLLKVGYTLVLISCFDEMDFTIIFSNKKYIIFDSRDTWVVEISKNGNGLYNIVYKADINIVENILTINKIH